MNTFNINTFFPTPRNVIRKMLSKFNTTDLSSMTILEPSAGKGDILDYIKELYEYNRHDKPDMYAIEQDANLKFILSGKNYKVIADDFLSYSGDYLFDLIVMNPPFNTGAKHLLKAWDAMNEGHIVCLLNAETINNPYTEERKLLKTILDDNKAELEFLGNYFSASERSTETEVVMITVHKKAERKRLDFTFNAVNSEDKFHINESTLKSQIATNDVIGNMIIQYGNLKEYFVKHLEAEEGLNFFSSGLFDQYTKINDLMKSDEKAKKQRFNSFCDNTKLAIWQHVIDQIGMSRYMTHQVRENFALFIKQQGAMDFTKENVFSMIRTLIVNKDTILENAISDVFDIFTKYHKENRCHVEGWKTNDAWKVNRRIILPWYVDKSWDRNYRENYHRDSEYSDIDRVMCYITGKNFERISSIKDEIRRTRIGDSSLHFAEFFSMRCYKKGTLHLEFRDEGLWHEFNMRACANKKWLPEAEEKEWKTKKETTSQKESRPETLFFGT